MRYRLDAVLVRIVMVPMWWKMRRQQRIHFHRRTRSWTSVYIFAYLRQILLTRKKIHKDYNTEKTIKYNKFVILLYRFGNYKLLPIIYLVESFNEELCSTNWNLFMWTLMVKKAESLSKYAYNGQRPLSVVVHQRIFVLRAYFYYTLFNSL